MRVAIINQGTKSQNFNNKSYQQKQSQFIQKTGIDTLDLSIKTAPSFKGRTVSKLFTSEGRQSMIDHFSILKGREPNIANKIDTIKNFLLELNTLAESKGQKIQFVWEKEHGDGLNFDNMYYTLQNGNDGPFNYVNTSVFGKAEELHELITEANLIDNGRRFDNKERYFCEKAHNEYGRGTNLIRGWVKDAILSVLRTKGPSRTLESGHYFKHNNSYDIMGIVENSVGNMYGAGEL